MDKVEKNILIVEDYSSLLDCMVEGISNYDYEHFSCKVDKASNGQEGLKKMTSHKYDLVITDMRMPKKDGPEFIRELRKLEAYKQTPIIFMSGYFRITAPELYQNVTKNLVYLEKPFNINKIRKTLKNMLLSSKKLN
ncbi:MAG: response regulator [Oligoflexales bacterium]|nr:response regulator [Oligoflexales bacterium]